MRNSLKEYTQIIINEADRLQNLMNRMLTPHQMPVYKKTNIHEILERVRSLILSEFSSDITFIRDYDVSLPEFIVDREKLIQAILNIARNGAQAMKLNNQEQYAAIIYYSSRKANCFFEKRNMPPLFESILLIMVRGLKRVNRQNIFSACHW